jgi:hypothetical protein
MLFKEFLGYRDLWMLQAVLNQDHVANAEKAA